MILVEQDRVYLKENVAFGDGENNTGILEFAEIGVAMAKAEQVVKQVADYVTANIDDDGVENALRHFGLI